MFGMVNWRLTAAWLYYRTTGREPSFIYFDDTVRPSRVRVTFTAPPSTTVDLETGAFAGAVVAPLFRRQS